MSRITRPRAIVLGSAALALTTAATALTATAGAGSRPPLSLVAASKEAQVMRWEQYLDLSNLGLYLTTGAKPVEVWTQRAGYDKPVTATLRIGSGAGARVTTLPK